VDSSAGQTYSATKVDGALAAAKTVELPDGKVAVVVPVQLLAMDHAVARRVLLHEAQHVRLMQNGDTAWAVHRRTGFNRPDELLWEFVWLAEILLDEFRCERSLYEKGEGDPEGGSTPDDYAGLRPLFLNVRREYQQSGDVMQMYLAAFQVLDRVPSILGYGAAKVAEDGSIDNWATVPEMAELLDVIRDIPGSRETVPDEELSGVILGVSELFREWLQGQGFDGYFKADGSKYFTLVN
jgi:hypothetical protein